jgi:hypothetical protein
MLNNFPPSHPENHTHYDIMYKNIVDPDKSRPRRRWEDNIKIDLQEVGWVRGDWT